MNEHFQTLGGNPAKWEAEMTRLPDRGVSLCGLQESQSIRGYLPAHLVESMYGWCVRYASGLQGFGILFGYRTNGGQRVSRDEAIAWGIAWANADPNNRHFYAAKRDLEKPDKWAKPAA